MVYVNLENAPSSSFEPGTLSIDADFDPEVVLDLAGIADLSDPIVGRHVTYSDEQGPGALPVRPLPSPQEPSPAAMARHFLTHLPYASWCPFCVAFRRPKNHHM